MHAQTTPAEIAGQGTRLEVAGHLDTAENVRMPAAHMPYLYAADQKRLVIYDLTQLQSPIGVGSLDLTTLISGTSDVAGTSDIFYVDIDDDLAYVAAGRNQVFVIDVSTPTTPTLVLQRQLPSWHDVWAVLADGEILYVFDSGPFDDWLGYHAILRTVDIADASEWRELDAIDIQGGGIGGGVVLRDNQVYLLTWIMGPSPYGGISGFTGIDVSQPAAITQTLFLPVNTRLSMAVGANGIAYLGDSDYGCRDRVYHGRMFAFSGDRARGR